MIAMMVGICLVGAGAFDFTPDDQTGWFPFVVPDLASDQTDQAAVDLSFLSPEPAGSHGFLRADAEHLVDDRGTTIRLFGSNFTDYHPLMPKESAEPAARRLKQLGINFIRLHYYDWSPVPYGILNKDGQTLNRDALDRLDFLISRLKANGVWVDLNLHVARNFPGQPKDWDRMGKGLDLIHEPYIQSEMQYARDLLTHVNPYTSNPYTSEPGIAVIELNNEDTALRGWDRYAALPKEFSDPLRARWNTWLKARYGSTAKLQAAWGGGLTGPELLRNPELADGGQGWVVQTSGGQGNLEVAAGLGLGGPRGLRWTVSEAGQADWHHQLQQQNLQVTDGHTYTLQFRGRMASGPPRKVQCTVMMQADPWSTVASGGDLDFTAAWTDFAVVLEVRNPDVKPVRLNLSCHNRTGVYELTDLSLREGIIPPLAEGETIEAGTVPLVSDLSHAGRARDYLRFLSDAEVDYVQRLRHLICDELGTKSMVFCTQVSYGGALGPFREGPTGDVTDCHAYPDHPTEREFDGKRVRAIRNVSMTGAGFSGLTRLASTRLAGKPYLVTEVDLNPPNDHGAQVFPLLALLAAYQDWSGFNDYAWYNFGVKPGMDHIGSLWGTAGVASQMVFVPTAALLFRLGLVQPAESRSVLTLPHDTAVQLVAQDLSGWSRIDAEQAGIGAGAAWTTGLALQTAAGDGPLSASAKVEAPADSKLVSDTGEIVFDRSERGREYVTVNAPALRLASGVVEGRKLSLGEVTLTFGPQLFRGFAQATLVALDLQPLAQSKRVLLTVASRVENTGMAYNAERSLVDWGTAPTLAEPVPLTVALPGSGWRAQALDGAGQPAKSIVLDGGRLVTRPSDATMWYLLTREWSAPG